MKNVTINNSEVERFITSHAAFSGNEFNEVVERLLERAMKDMQYRSRRNAQKWQETKEMKMNIKELEAKLAHLQTLQEIGAGREEEIDEK